MFASQRINLIKQILLDEKQVNITSLALRLNVSDVTVRKDLDVLEKEGFLKKVHGGAILTEDETQNPIEFVSNVSSYAEKKEYSRPRCQFTAGFDEPVPWTGDDL